MLILGYNHPALVDAAKSERWQRAIINRPALGMVPPNYWPELLDSFMSVAPKGLSHVFTAMCGSCSNEIAYKAAFMHYMQKKRGGDPSEEDLNSCMCNSEPGSPDITILSFKGGFHGRLFGSLSTTRSKAIHKVDIPAFDWPVAPFPKLKYPLNKNVEANQEEEARCVQEVYYLIWLMVV